jgi:hypothetical protein
MAFCTKCGAGLNGAFCMQCGAPAAQQAQGPAIPADAPMSAATPPMTPAPPPPAATRKTSPIVWILVIVFGLFALGAIGVVGTGWFVLHKVRRAGLDPDLFRTNPGLAVGKILAATNPDLDVVDTNEGAGTVTVRDRRNGKRFTMSFDAARNGSFSMKADDGDGKGGTLEFGAAAKLPSWLPQYPGSHAEPMFSAKGSSDDGAGEAGNFTFKTDDPPSKVLSFYEDKAKELGMSLQRINAAGTATIVASGESDKFLKVLTMEDSGQTTVNVTYGRKR